MSAEQSCGCLSPQFGAVTNGDESHHTVCQLNLRGGWDMESPDAALLHKTPWAAFNYPCHTGVGEDGKQSWVKVALKQPLASGYLKAAEVNTYLWGSCET